MPGIIAVQGAYNGDALDTALESVRFTDRYDIERYPTGGRTTHLASTAYPTYPIEYRRVDGCRVVFEGHLYRPDGVEGFLNEIVSAVRGGDSTSLRDCIGSSDGDFLVTVHDPTDGSITVINDVFKRLPVFYAIVDGSPVIARELKFIREYARSTGDPLDLDPLGVGQSLLLGYELGERTLFDGVRCLAPGTRLTVTDGQFETESLYVHDFEEKKYADRDVTENAEKLVSLFTDACETRGTTTPGRPIVSLSGGLDSRAVVAGYDAAGVDPAAVTSTVETPGSADERPIAREVAETLDVDIESISVGHSERNRTLLFEMTQGTNSLVMDYTLDFYDHLLSRGEAVSFVTGDGGDKTVKNLRPAGQFDTLPELATHLIEDEQYFEIEHAASVAGIPPERLVESVWDRLRSYPERSLEDKYVHFKIRERALNRFTYGEDRSRGFLWSTTPFYSRPFFEYAMNVPDEQKKYNALCREFLTALSPSLADIEYYDFGAPLNSLECRLKIRAYTLLGARPRIRSVCIRLLRSLKSDSRESDDTETEIDDLVSNCIDDVRWGAGLNRAGVESLLEDTGEYSTRHLYKLVTVLSLAAVEVERSDTEAEEVIQIA